MVDEGLKGDISFFMSKGWTYEQSVGIVANIKAESGGESHGKAGDAGNAVGMGQWWPDRQKRFFQMFGHTIQKGTRQEQLEFYNAELTNPNWEGDAGKHLRGQTTVRGSGGSVSRKFERPGIDETARAREERDRGATAEEIAKILPRSTFTVVTNNMNPSSIQVSTNAQGQST
jgi:hypothetical protein